MRAEPPAYHLQDFGGGARLERWGDVVLVRPDARATGARALPPSAWDRADAVFEGRVGGGQWHPPGPPLPDRWEVVHAGLRFLAARAPSGHTGLFPEQATHWSWMVAVPPTTPESSPGRTTPESTPESLEKPDSIDDPTPDSTPETTPESFRVLNLFAYTGGASIALARAGARVTHVDASRPAIGWAQANAGLNGVDTIRWIQDDARRFVERERRRGRRYAGLLLDPPAYGRGPAGDWQLDRDLPDLLESAVELLEPDPAFVLLNVYRGDRTAADLERLLAWALDGRAALGPVDAGTLTLTAVDGRRLDTGIYARARRLPRPPR